METDLKMLDLLMKLIRMMCKFICQKVGKNERLSDVLYIFVYSLNSLISIIKV